MESFPVANYLLTGNPQTTNKFPNVMLIDGLRLLCHQSMADFYGNR